MEKLSDFFSSLPIWLYIVVGVAVVTIVGLLIWRLISRGSFRRKLKRVIEDPQLVQPLIRDKTSGAALLRKSSIIEKMAEKGNPDLVELIGVDDLWVQNLKARKRKKDFMRILRYASRKGLFQCFLISMEKPNLAPILVSWLESTGEFLYMRKLAVAGIGEPFSGRQALEVFKEKLPEIREMTGDPEWPSRYFAVKVLLHDQDDRSARAVWEAFADPHPLVRKTAALEFQTDQTERLYKELAGLYLDDPVFEVRRAAWQRIHAGFEEYHSLDPASLTEKQTFHVLELLDPQAEGDRDFALRFLDSENLELRRSAAAFLDRCGLLKKLCLEADFEDQEALERNQGLLKKAAEVNVTGFLSSVRESQKTAPLLICAKILAKRGDRSHITTLARKVFGQFSGQPDLHELYQATATSVSTRGDEESLRLLNRELQRWGTDREMMEFLLPLVPTRGDFLFLERLFDFLLNPGFPAKESLRSCLIDMSRPEVLDRVLEILRADRDAYPHVVRMEAVKLLGEMKLPYCLQILLENLFILPVEEAREFTRVLSQFPTELFKEKVTDLIESADAKVRAALIASLSVTEDRSFLRSIRLALKDADPDVRIAAVWALVEFQDYRSLKQAASLLRDPVERVRSAVGRAFGTYGSDEALAQLREVLFDENEVDTVKKACIQGLGSSSALKAVDILLENLESGDGLTEQVIEVLARDAVKKKLNRIVEHFKDAPPSLRDKITSAFVAMKEAGEESIIELLQEDISSLKPYLDSILEKTGYVEDKIRKLRHRSPAVRRDAAAFLSLVGTQSAFRGMVMAARDPDEEVRVKVIKALEKLETDEGKEILQTLENDPDKKVRTYTQWALERLRAKAL
jgi:HEAT repeat protein